MQVRSLGWEDPLKEEMAIYFNILTEFSRQEYWSGWPCPPTGDLPKPGIEPASLASPALAGGFFTNLSHQRSPVLWVRSCNSLPQWKCEEWEMNVSKS